MGEQKLARSFPIQNLPSQGPGEQVRIVWPGGSGGVKRAAIVQLCLERSRQTGVDETAARVVNVTGKIVIRSRWVVIEKIVHANSQLGVIEQAAPGRLNRDGKCSVHAGEECVSRSYDARNRTARSEFSFFLFSPEQVERVSRNLKRSAENGLATGALALQLLP